ncbi:MAG: hypothetical protein ABI863_07520 [Ginsengibacter sp.]
MKSVLIEDEAGICKVVHYIHANPAHHGFVKELGEWKFSSYNAYLSPSVTKLSRKVILDIFGSKEYFLEYHRQPIELKPKWDVYF